MRNFIVTIDGKSYQVGVEEVGSDVSVAPATNKELNIPAAVQAPTASKKEINGEKLLSPFPGLIKNLLVTEGATVKKDQPVLVLEAMKMDNDITAPCDGTISFKVAKGNNVESNTVLAVIG